MSLRLRTLLMVGALAVVTAASGGGADCARWARFPQAAPQTPPQDQPAPKPAPDALAPNNPDFKPEVAGYRRHRPRRRFRQRCGTSINAEDLLSYIAAVGKEGLNPADYDPAGLQAAIQTGNIAADVGSGDRPLQPALVRPRARPCEEAGADRLVGRGPRPQRRRSRTRCCARRLPAHAISGALDGLLPTHPQYAALKAALAETPPSDEAKRDRIRLNLDRWRWLPRDLGTNISSSTCRASTRRWSRMGSTAGSSARSPASCRPRRRSSMPWRPA